MIYVIKINMESKSKKEDEKKQQKKEEQERKEKEVEEKLKEIENSFKEVKIKKENLKDGFNKHLKAVLTLWRKKIKNEKILDDLYLNTARMIELSLTEKDLNNFQDSLTDEEKCDLIKFFYMTYERQSKKQNCLTLKPAKIYNLHHTIQAKAGVGIVSRAMFSIQK